MRPTDDVAKAYLAWDESFNKGDAVALASAYLPDGKVLPPTHSVVSGTAEIERFFAELKLVAEQIDVAHFPQHAAARDGERLAGSEGAARGCEKNPR